MPSKLLLLRERYHVMRDAGVPTKVRQVSHTSSARFSEAMRSVGKDPNDWPHLINANKAFRTGYSMNPFAIMRRECRAQLKAAGLDPKRCDHWSRNEPATKYALRAIAAGRMDRLPERPGLLRPRSAPSRGSAVRELSSAPAAQAARARSAALRAAGLDWARIRHWHKGEASTQYALRMIAAGRIADLPERPSRVRAAAKRAAEALTTVAVVLLLCFNGWGCAAWPYDPPAYYSIDDQFSEAEAGAIRGAFDAWCAAVGYCPTEALWSERGAVELVDDLPENGHTIRVCPEGRDCSTSGMNHHGNQVWIAANRVFADDLAGLWWVVAHEVGHYCMEHTDRGLMAAAQELAPDDRELVIDADAIAGWKAGCQ